MQGAYDEERKLQGIVPRMVQTIFRRIENSPEEIEFTVSVSMLEIYLEEVKDLLNPSKKKLLIKQDPQKGVFIPGLVEKYIATQEEIYEIMNEGNNSRTVSATEMNDVSSRSHSIFAITIS